MKASDPLRRRAGGDRAMLLSRGIGEQTAPLNLEGLQSRQSRLGPVRIHRNSCIALSLVQIDSDPGSIAKSHLAVLDGEHAAKLCIPEVVGIDVDL